MKEQELAVKTTLYLTLKENETRSAAAERLRSLLETAGITCLDFTENECEIRKI